MRGLGSKMGQVDALAKNHPPLCPPEGKGLLCLDWNWMLAALLLPNHRQCMWFCRVIGRANPSVSVQNVIMTMWLVRGAHLSL